MAAPRYVVRALRFRCVDESGFDFLGSDEPFWVFTAKQASGETHTTRSQVFGDIDSGNTRVFAADDGRNIVWPQKGDIKGDAGPIALSVQLWEHDQGDPDEIARKTKQLLDLGTLALPGWVEKVAGVVVGQLNKLLGDDLMGSRTLLFPASRLARRMPKVGDRMIQKFHFGGSSGDLPFDVAGGPDYDLILEVRRVA